MFFLATVFISSGQITPHSKVKDIPKFHNKNLGKYMDASLRSFFWVWLHLISFTSSSAFIEVTPKDGKGYLTNLRLDVGVPLIGKGISTVPEMTGTLVFGQLLELTKQKKGGA